MVVKGVEWGYIEEVAKGLRSLNILPFYDRFEEELVML